MAAQYLLHDLPDEVILLVFSYLMEKDLCRVSQVCRRFRSIANDVELWYVLHLMYIFSFCLCWFLLVQICFNAYFAGKSCTSHCMSMTFHFSTQKFVALNLKMCQTVNMLILGK